LERADAMLAKDAAEIDTSKVTPDGSGVPQLAAHQVMLFPNSHKLKDGDPGYAGLDDDAKAVNAKRPDVWGYWNPGHGEPQLNIAAWNIEGRYGPFLGGNTQVPQPGRNIGTEAQPAQVVEKFQSKGQARRGRGRE
jgi:hypothetical protein